MNTEIRTVDNIFGVNAEDWSEINSTGAESIATVYACSRIIANTIASTPLNYITKDNDVIVKNPVSNMIQNTNFSFFNNLIYDYVLHGNGYALLLQNELIYIPQSQVAIYVTQEAGHYYNVTRNGKVFQIWPENIIHLKNVTNDGITGISPISLHRATFTGALNMSSYQTNFVDNSAAIAGVITTEKKLNKETVEILRENFSNKFSGSQNAGKIPVLPEAMKFQQLDRISPIDLGYIQQSELTKVNIAEIFGVPLSMISSTATKYSNAEQQALMYNNYTIQPILINLQEELTLKLLSIRNTNKYQFKVDTIAMSDSKSKADSISLLTNTGIITPNEARKYYGLPAVAGGDELQSEKENEVGDEQAEPKNTEKTNATAEKDTPPSKRYNQRKGKK